MECSTARTVKGLKLQIEELEDVVASHVLKLELLQVQMTNLYQFTASQVKLEEIEP